MLIIGLTGPKGSGKDTVADMLVEHYKGRWKDVTRLAFADPIKKTIQHIFDLDPTNNEQYDRFKRSDINYQLSGYLSHSVPGRHVVREIGMMMRGYDEKQFNNYVEDHFKNAHFTSNRVFIITDMRFDNEYTMLKKWDATIVKVDRPGYHYDGHITERGFDDQLVDYTIHNEGSLADLMQATRKMIADINKENT